MISFTASLTPIRNTCDLCKSTLVDDDSYDDRRTLLSFKAYDSDASYGGVDCPIQCYAPIYNATRRNICKAL